MALQNINEQFLEFIQEQDINVPENFVQMFYTSISLDQWISSEFAQQYLEYSRQDNFSKKLQKFVIDLDYQEITKEQYDQFCSSLTCKQNQNQNNMKTQGGLNKKYYLLSPDCFKTMLLMRHSEKGKQYHNYMITLEKIFKEFILYFYEKQNKQLQRKLIQSQQQIQELQQQQQQELQERDQQQLQLEDEIDQYQHKFSFFNFQKKPQQPQIIYFPSNIQEIVKLYTKLLNEFYEEQFEYYYEVIGQNLSRQEAIYLKQQTIIQFTGQQRNQHQNIQRIKPLFV